MSSPTYNPLTDDRIIASLHLTGGVWRAVAAERTNGSISLIESREFAPSERDQIDTWLDQHQVGRTVCVLPGGTVICRTAQLPDAPPEQLQAALRLQAETHLLGTAPAHRQAIAVLDQARGESTRSGLILAWPQRAEPPDLPLTRAVSYVPDIACLAAVLDGERTGEPVLWADQSNGAMALALCHNDGAVFRAACEETGDRASWTEAVGRLLAETAYSVGYTDDHTEQLIVNTTGAMLDHEDGSGTLMLPTEIRTSVTNRCKGIPADPAWWSRFGIAAGALLVMAGPLAALAELRDVAPIEKPSFGDRLTQRLASRRTAAGWLVAALVLLGMGPVTFSGLKLYTLYSKVGALEEFNSTRNERSQALVMYEHLQANNWPMVKLLADISNCAPPGVVFDTLNLEESGNVVDLRGSSNSPDLVIEMCNTMRGTGIFEKISNTYTGREQGEIQFTITAQVRQAFRVAEYDGDFAEVSLSERLYPNEHAAIRRYNEEEAAATDPGLITTEPTERLADAGNSTTPVLPPTAGDESDPAGDEASNGIGNTSEFGGRTGPRPRRPANIPGVARNGGGAPPPVELPEPVEEEVMATMNRSQLISKMAALARAKRIPRLTPEQTAQLDEQFDLLKDRLSELSDGGGL